MIDRDAFNTAWAEQKQVSLTQHLTKLLLDDIYDKLVELKKEIDELKEANKEINPDPVVEPEVNPEPISDPEPEDPANNVYEEE